MKRNNKTVFFMFLAFLLLLVCVPVSAAARKTAGTGTQKSGGFQLVLCYNDGSVCKKVTVGSGGYRLPELKNTADATFMGWSSRRRESVKPKYKGGQKITIRKTTKLYAVMFDRRTEKDLKKKNIAVLDRHKYNNIIFVGDSRTFHAESILREEFGKSYAPEATFISRGGVGLSWMKSTGCRRLMKAVKKGRKNASKPTAVVFNLGVNDLRHNGAGPAGSGVTATAYVSYMKKLSEELKQNGCKLFFMSVNPVNGKMTKLRREEEIDKFNQRVEDGLSGIYTYIDTNAYLMNHGYSTNRHARNSGRDDGTHYTPKTYKRIYDYCIRRVNRY